jgi:hypothetical protein
MCRCENHSPLIKGLRSEMCIHVVINLCAFGFIDVDWDWELNNCRAIPPGPNSTAARVHIGAAVERATKARRGG